MGSKMLAHQVSDQILVVISDCQDGSNNYKESGNRIKSNQVPAELSDYTRCPNAVYAVYARS